MSLLLDNTELDSNLIEAFREVEKTKEYDYYHCFKPHLGRWEGYRTYIAVFIGLAKHGAGPGKEIQHIAQLLHGHPFEVQRLLGLVDRSLAVLPHPLAKSTTQAWIGKMFLFSERQQDTRRMVLSKILQDHVVKKILKRAYPNLLENREIENIEHSISLLIVNFPD
jgi:hypothetical protein